MPYDPIKDIDPVVIGATSPVVLAVHPSVPAKTVAELVALVRAGTYNNFAIAGAGTPPHLSSQRHLGFWVSRTHHDFGPIDSLVAEFLRRQFLPQRIGKRIKEGLGAIVDSLVRARHEARN
jgi:hypothetical protein